MWQSLRGREELAAELGACLALILDQRSEAIVTIAIDCTSDRCEKGDRGDMAYEMHFRGYVVERMD